MKFKVGDRVEVVKKETDDDERYLGEVFTISEVSDSLVGSRKNEGLYCIDDATCLHWWYEEYLKLVKEGKKMKPKKVEKHVLIMDDCFNVQDFYDSAKEAREQGKHFCKDGNICTVYKLVPVYHYEPSVKESRVK